MKALLKCIMAAVFIPFAVVAKAEIASFDDISSGSGYVTLNTYNGFSWSNFYATDQSIYGANNPYGRGATSGSMYVFGSGNKTSTIERTGGGLFDVKSASFSSVFDDGLKLKVTGWLDGVAVHSQTIVLSTKQNMLAQLNFFGINKLTFTTTNSGRPLGRQFTMDDIDYVPSSSVPEPSTYVMVLIGLGCCIALFLKRRKTT